MPRLPADAFERFVALGDGRSYAKLALALGCSKRSVTAKAGKENWQQRLAGIESLARAKSDQKLAETTAAINDRHLRTLRAVQLKALQALTGSPMGTAAQAAATLIAAVRAERAIVAPQGEHGAAGGSLAELIEASRAVPKARIEELCKLSEAIPVQPPVQAPPAEPIVPPVLAPRVVIEN